MKAKYFGLKSYNFSQMVLKFIVIFEKGVNFNPFFSFPTSFLSPSEGGRSAS